jgi:hypothetical protein
MERVITNHNTHYLSFRARGANYTLQLSNLSRNQYTRVVTPSYRTVFTSLLLYTVLR